MFIKQFVDEGLGNSSYLIASEASGFAAVIDPQRDIDKSAQVADRFGLMIAYAFDLDAPLIVWAGWLIPYLPRDRSCGGAAMRI